MIGHLPQLPEMGPFTVELRNTSGFYLRRVGDADMGEPGEGAVDDCLLIDPAELPALLAALFQVWAHPHFAEIRWDVSRAWLSPDGPIPYTPEQIEAANAPWAVSRTAAAVVIEGPLWNPTVWGDGAFQVEIEYARLEGLYAALADV